MSEAPSETRERVVLLAEDEATIRALVRSLLTSEGYKVLEAVDGSHALEVSREFPGEIHLLLTDIRMPRMNGTELARRIREERPSIVVLTMSAYSSGELEKIAKSSHFIQKPFVARALSQKIREVLQYPATDAEF